MTVPGASGGTMAMLLGIYQELLEAITDFFKAPISNGKLLLQTALGGILGLVCVSGWVKGWMLFYPTGSTFFFEGCMGGGIVLILAEGFRGPKKGLWKRLLLLLPGLASGFTAVYYPLSFHGDGVLYRMLMGVILAAALILPGVSVSASLYMLGLYYPFFDALERVDFGFLLPIIAGGIAGGAATAGILGKIMGKYPRGCRFLIAGFLMASFAAELPGQWESAAPAGGIPWLLAGGIWIGCPVIYEKIKNRRKINHVDTQSPAEG